MVADFDDTTTITFPDSPSGTLSEIVVNYYFELRTLKLFSSSGKIPKGGLPFYIDGQKVAYVDEAGDLVQETSSPLKVPKDSWPASAEKTKTWRHSGYGTYALIIQKAEITCVSTVSELEQQGKTVEKEASSLPVGAHTSQTTVDDSASVSFPAAPSGNLSDIVIEVRWALTITGDRITSDKPRVYSIGGQPVKILGQTLSYNLMAGTIYLPQSAWQTSIAKTKSRLDEFGRGEEFVILSAVQRCRTDDFSADYELSGNSMADAKLGGRVSADVDGFLDDGSGTITGTAGALIERPDHIAEHMLTDRCGLAAARIDATAYAAAGSTYNTEGYKLAFPILQPPSLPKLLNRVAHQAKSVQFWAAGVHKLVYAADAPSVDKIIYEHMIDLGQIWVKRTNRADIVNTATARYARDWSGFSDDREADRKTVTKTDSASVTKYGTLYGDERSYPYIPEGSEAQAQDVLDWEVSRRAAQKLVIEFAGGYFLTALEPGDVVQFSFDSGSALDNALLNLVTSETDKFRVIDRRDRSDAAKQFEMIEI